jgi:hypothetical protein
MFRLMRSILLLSLLLGLAIPVCADDGGWEYQVVILQGLTAGGTIEKQDRGIYVDTKRTQALNELADDGWELVSVIAGPGADHSVYLRRKRNK